MERIINLNKRTIKAASSVSALIGLANATGCSDGVEQIAKETPTASPIESASTIDNAPMVILNDDQTELDEECKYLVMNGQINQFSGPLPDGKVFNLFARVAIVSANEVQIGPFLFEEGDRIGLHYQNENWIIPLGLIQNISEGRMEFVPVIPSIGENDCHRPKGGPGA